MAYSNIPKKYAYYAYLHTCMHNKLISLLFEWQWQQDNPTETNDTSHITLHITAIITMVRHCLAYCQVSVPLFVIQLETNNPKGQGTILHCTLHSNMHTIRINLALTSSTTKHYSTTRLFE